MSIEFLVPRLVYVWGYNGYCRLGLGNQVDILKPKVVPQVNQTFPSYCIDVIVLAVRWPK